MAIFTLLIGVFRTWRTQNAIVRGKAITGGFEIIFLALGVFAVSLLNIEIVNDIANLIISDSTHVLRPHSGSRH